MLPENGSYALPFFLDSVTVVDVGGVSLFGTDSIQQCNLLKSLMLIICNKFSLSINSRGNVMSS